jgi:hypothetical protein
MQGRLTEAEELTGPALALIARTSLEPRDVLAVGVLLPLRLWQGRSAELLDALPAGDEAAELGARLLLNLRAGRDHEVRRLYDRFGLPPRTDDWLTVWSAAIAAECALVLGLRDEGAAAYALLAPLAGAVASAGSGAALGPVDAFLACAAAAAGERAAASRHADDALALCEQWRIPLVAAWLNSYRERFDF